MDKSQLTVKMIDWELKKKELDELEAEIKNEVMLLEESFDAGNVHARFSGGRRTFDYETAGSNVPKEIIDECTITTVSTDWKKVCEKAKIENVPFTIGNPSVSLSIR